MEKRDKLMEILEELMLQAELLIAIESTNNQNEKNI